MNKRVLRVLEYDKIKDKLKKYAVSELSKSFIEHVKPLNDYDKIENLLKETSEITSLLYSNNLHIGPFTDMSVYLKRAKIGNFLYPDELLKVSTTFRTTRNIKIAIKKANTPEVKYPIFNDMVETLVSFKDIEDRIEYTVISDTELSDNASRELASIRNSINRKNDAIRNKLDSIIRSKSDFLQEAIVTIREGRFVIPVKSDHKSSLKGIVHDRSSSGNTIFIEPMAVVELNNDLRELKIKEQKEIERILLEITNEIYSFHDSIMSNQSILKHLDFSIAKGKLSIEMKGSEPRLLKDKSFKLRNARHPFLDPKTVVPSTIYLGKDFTTLLITGPNTGGKTVTLKTVGLLLLMAQTGLHIPADYGTELSVFDEIYADIGDEQSIEQSLSTFSSHMTNIVYILENIKENDLVLFDELGAGTDPTEGAALAMAILDQLHTRSIRTIATTHYSELKHFAFNNKGIENACVEFDIDTLSPTYKLLIGIPGKSNAFEISRKLGLHNSIISSARNLVDNNNIEFENVLESIEHSKKTADKERDEAIKLRMEVEELQEKLSRKSDSIDKRREKLIAEAKKEANKILKEAKKESDEIIKELRDIKKSNIDNKKIEEYRKRLKNKLDKTNSTISDIESDEIPTNLQLGETVYVVNLKQKGEVVSLPDNNGNLTVRVGILKTKVNINKLRRAEADKKVVVKTSYRRSTKAIKSSIDLRGMNYEEAIYHLDRYIDDIALSSLDTVTIIHGVGTGALKSKLKHYFKKHPMIKKFREGEFGEGGAGVTIVTVKK